MVSTRFMRTVGVLQLAPGERDPRLPHCSCQTDDRGDWAIRSRRHSSGACGGVPFAPVKPTRSRHGEGCDRSNRDVRGIVFRLVGASRLERRGTPWNASSRFLERIRTETAGQSAGQASIWDHNRRPMGSVLSGRDPGHGSALNEHGTRERRIWNAFGSNPERVHVKPSGESATHMCRSPRQERAGCRQAAPTTANAADIEPP